MIQGDRSVFNMTVTIAILDLRFEIAESCVRQSAIRNLQSKISLGGSKRAIGMGARV
jgi:hypothetical protein